MSEPTSPDQPAVPPVAPPTPDAPQGAVPQWSPPPPGYPAGPPVAGGPPVAPPTGPGPQTAEIPPVPPSAWPPADPATSPPAPGAGGAGSAARSGLKILAALVLTVILVGGALAGISALSGSVPTPEVTVARCDIAASGQVTAGGALRNNDDEPRTYTLTVELRSVRGGEWSRSVQVPVQVGPGGGDDQASWSTRSQAPDSVQQVSCRVVDYSTT
ncbi:MAG: hypothetical protein ACKO04_02550 [Actinomycetes bacterium]